MKHWPLKFLSISFLVALSGCQRGIDSGSAQDAPNLSDYLTINSTAPANNQQNIALDQEVQIGFNEKIDAPSVDSSQVEVWTAQGAKIPWNQLQVGGRFVQGGSILKIKPKTEWLPQTTYYVALRGVLPDSNTNPVLAGIRSIYGGPLIPTSITFTTGSNYKSGGSDTLQVRAMSPGRLIANGMNVDTGSSFGDLFSDAATVVNNNDIKISFSTPVRHFSVDSYERPLTSEIPVTASNNLPGFSVFVLDSRANVSEFMNSIPTDSTNLNEWGDFVRSARQIKGFVHTENSRRLLVFKPDPNCVDKNECTYPDNTSVGSIGQVVVVVIQGFVSVVRNEPIKNQPVVGSFVHISGYRVGDGYAGAGAALGSAIKGIFSE